MNRIFEAESASALMSMSPLIRRYRVLYLQMSILTKNFIGRILVQPVRVYQLLAILVGMCKDTLLLSDCPLHFSSCA